MWKTLCRHLSDVCWWLGLERLSMKLLLWTLASGPDSVVPMVPVQLDHISRRDPLTPQVVFSDEELLVQLAERYVINDVAYVKNAYDIN